MIHPRERLIARRKLLGFSQASLAHAIPCERTTVSRWERGETDVATYHRDPLARELKVSLTELDGLLNGAGPELAPAWANLFTTIEQTAVTLRHWEPILVPGLLQTRDYAAAILKDEHMIDTRVERQGALYRESDPLDLTAVVDESVLHRPIGGHDVLYAQLNHLTTIVARPNVDVRVLPLSAQEQPFFFGTLLLFGFPWAADGLAYTEHGTGPVYIDRPGDLEAHAARFDRLLEVALPPQDSLDLIRLAAKEIAQ